MPKLKTSFFCQSCGVRSSKWIGHCPSCDEWNTYVEEVIETENTKSVWKKYDPRPAASDPRPILLSEIDPYTEDRVDSGDKELNRLLGGGIVPGSLILVGGEPGIGKSTLMLQLALAQENMKVLYVTGEESTQQIKMRAERISTKINHCFILSETATEKVFNQILKINNDQSSEKKSGNGETTKVGMVIIDSIQTLVSERIEAPAGSVSQIRQCAAELQQFAKETHTPVFLIGHITKEGSIAGPKVLEHMVDTVLQFEGDQHYAYRILRTLKNRFGSTAELGIYEMSSSGLRQVENPSEILITQRTEPLSGIAVASTLEGIRPMLIETQALVSNAVYGTPQRSNTGFDLRRLNMLLAVLEKRSGFKFGVKDVFLNIAGGLKVEDPAIDLAVVCALLSSFEDVPIHSNICFAGEIGLSGEVRAVNRIEQRISEADKLGFEKIFVSRFNQKSIDKKKFNLEITLIGKVDEIYALLF